MKRLSSAEVFAVITILLFIVCIFIAMAVDFTAWSCYLLSGFIGASVGALIALRNDESKRW